MEEHILAIGAQQPPYNRTDAFSLLTHEILSGLKYVAQTSGEVALLTGSGTLAMEAAVVNFLTIDDVVIVINGGTFGQRWCDLCRIHAIPYHEIKLTAGADVDLDQLRELCETENCTALLINAHETSTGQLYDIEAIGRLAHDFDLLYIVDAISTVCADAFQMDEWDVDVAILSSQKALALPPGLSFVAMGARALVRLHESAPKTLYLNLQDYLANQARGQSPYTPAIGLFLQLHQRLLDVQQQTMPEVVAQHGERASTFRAAIVGLPFSILPSQPSNALTALMCEASNAPQVVGHLQSHHAMEIAPSGGLLKDKLIRISHMGRQSRSDQDLIISALADAAQVLSTERKSL